MRTPISLWKYTFLLFPLRRWHHFIGIYRYSHYQNERGLQLLPIEMQFPGRFGLKPVREGYSKEREWGANNGCMLMPIAH